MDPGCGYTHTTHLLDYRVVQQLLATLLVVYLLYRSTSTPSAVVLIESSIWLCSTIGIYYGCSTTHGLMILWIIILDTMYYEYVLMHYCTSSTILHYCTVGSIPLLLWYTSSTVVLLSSRGSCSISRP